MDKNNNVSVMLVPCLNSVLKYSVSPIRHFGTGSSYGLYVISVRNWGMGSTAFLYGIKIWTVPLSVGLKQGGWCRARPWSREGGGSTPKTLSTIFILVSQNAQKTSKIPLQMQQWVINCDKRWRLLGVMFLLFFRILLHCIVHTVSFYLIKNHLNSLRNTQSLLVTNDVAVDPLELLHRFMQL